ncbi:MAG: alpha-L-rhamnosidase C-terminal domain-containing protein [Opitutaceae bacterium]
MPRRAHAHFLTKPSCARLRVAPQLGHLTWAEGAYPTPLGPVKVRHERRPNGEIHSQIDAPPGIEIVRKA